VISIILPAYNEASVIGRSLAALTEAALPGELDIVVVCNGCTDNTAELARSFGSPVRVIETAVGNKAHALNLGDKAAGSAFPRIYLDADVVVSLDTVRALARRLAEGDVLAVAPGADIDLSGCTWPVRWYHHVASLLPSAREGIGGSGVYALSQTGRRRFGNFPNVIADDGYVRIQFKPNECETIPTFSSRVSPPRKMKDLIRVRTRVRRGNLEIARILPDAWRNNRQSNDKSILRLFWQVVLWPKLFIYCYVNVIARCRARGYSRNPDIWERDDASRTTMPEGAPPGRSAVRSGDRRSVAPGIVPEGTRNTLHCEEIR
jgi:glycosyltransferase involved in cell wall biosynthesis